VKATPAEVTVPAWAWAAFVVAGVTLLEAFHPVIYLFGAVLLAAALTMLRGGHQPRPKHSRALKALTGVIAVVLAAVAALSICDSRRAARPPAHGNQERTDVPQPAESAPVFAGEPAAGNSVGRLPGSGDGQLVVTVAVMGEPSAQR